jgi:hypothetical protein
MYLHPDLLPTLIAHRRERLVTEWTACSNNKENVAMKPKGFRARTRRSAPAALSLLLAACLAIAAAGPLTVAAKDGNGKKAKDGMGVELTKQFFNTTPIQIPDDGDPPAPASPYPSEIEVSGLQGSIVDVDVILRGIEHNKPSDLDVLLVGPQGQNLIIMSDAGDSAELFNLTLTIDDEAPDLMPKDGPLDPNPLDSDETEAYRPTNFNGIEPFPAPAPAPQNTTSLATAFDGTDPNGTWQLFVVQSGGDNDTDNINNGWNLRITTAEPGGNDGLQANDDQFAVKAGKTLKGAVLGNDVDAEGDALTVELIDSPKGTLQLAADGGFTYKAKKKAKGTDSFVYAASDGAGSDQATVTIKIKKAKKNKKGKK